MATYNNQHWLLCHIRNSFISTDDTEMCEAVMTSDDLPKKIFSKHSENEHFCYPGLNQSDDEDMDATVHSYEIHMYLDDFGVYRFRSNNAKKENKSHKSAPSVKAKNIKVDDSLIAQANDLTTKYSDFFQRKDIVTDTKVDNTKKETKSLLSEQILKGPKFPQNKFIHYARLDGESLNGSTHLNIFLNLTTESQPLLPMKICVVPQAKVEEVIGFICYKLTLKYPEIQLQSVRNYGLYISEDNGEMLSEFPPLDMKAFCQKYEFQYLTLAERHITNSLNRIDYRSFSLNSETDAAREKALDEAFDRHENATEDMERMLDHNLMIEAPVYRSFHVHMMGKGFFKPEVQLGISGERIEIYPVASSNKFLSKQKAISHSIESIAFCELFPKKNNKAIIRIWYLSNSGGNLNPSFNINDYKNLKSNIFGQLGLHNIAGNSSSSNILFTNSASSSPQHFNAIRNHTSINFKFYDFETDQQNGNQILNKINFILKVRSTSARKEFLSYREKRKAK